MFENKAVWVLVSAIAFYWTMVVVLRTDGARNAVDIVAMVLSFSLLLRLVPHAWDRFRQGGMRKEWQVIMGLALLFANIFFSAAWGFAVRAEGRPFWMVENPLNGFFRWWSVGAAMLLLSAISDTETGRTPPLKLYYVVILFAGAILIGAAATRFLDGAG